MAARMSRVRPLVGVKWLRDALCSSGPSLRVLETSFAPPGKGLESYLEKHIPSSSFFDMWRCCHPTQFETKPVHEPACFQEYARALGVRKEQHLVIYDKGSLYFAARLWLTFKNFGHPSVSVLNGGFPSWEAMRYPVEEGEDTTQCDPGDFVARPACGRFMNFADINELRKKPKHQILDVRTFCDFKGDGIEPSENTLRSIEAAGLCAPEEMLAGHVPGAKHIRKDMFVHPERHEVHGAPELQSAFARQGVDLSRPITSMCYNGVSACLIPLAAAEAGDEDASVYVGSWSEYGQRASSVDVETGPGIHPITTDTPPAGA